MYLFCLLCCVAHHHSIILIYACGSQTLICKSFLVSRGFFFSILYMNCTKWMHSADLISAYPHVLSLKLLNRFLWNFYIWTLHIEFYRVWPTPISYKAKNWILIVFLKTAYYKKKMTWCIVCLPLDHGLLFETFFDVVIIQWATLVTHIHMFY